jgi:FkbM family methyltransferase
LIASWFLPRTDREFELDVGSRYCGNLDNYIEWVVYLSGQYFEFPYINLVRRIGGGGVALDVGANVGNHALAFSEIFEQVHALEPYPPVFRRLQERRAVSARIHPHQIALSDRPGSISFEAPTTDNLGTGRVAPGGELTVEAMRGDDFVATEINEPIVFIKIDVEGHEAEVIQGLNNTLRRDRPTVMFEASSRAMGSRDAMKSFFSLFPTDYLFFKVGGQSTWPVQREVARVHPFDPETARPRRRSCDMLCWGREKAVDIAALNR